MLSLYSGGVCVARLVQVDGIMMLIKCGAFPATCSCKIPRTLLR
jgi:hypothetical protein